MSRIGKQPVTIPSIVKGAVSNGVVQVEGPKGKLSFTPGRGIAVVIDAGKFLVKCENLSDKQQKANYGTARARINGMVLGVSTGWKRSLELNGVGFVAKMQGTKLVLAVGFSHDVELNIPKEVKCTITKNIIDLESADKQILGAFAAKIRGVQPPEPYLGKGIKYTHEKIRRKAGKAGKK